MLECACADIVFIVQFVLIATILLELQISQIECQTYPVFRFYSLFHSFFFAEVCQYFWHFFRLARSSFNIEFHLLVVMRWSNSVYQMEHIRRSITIFMIRFHLLL